LIAIVATTHFSQGSFWGHWRSTSGIQLRQPEAEMDEFNFLSFLATAQAFKIDFFPLREKAGVMSPASGLCQNTAISCDHE
jgi:hypothetical protein